MKTRPEIKALAKEAVAAQRKTAVCLELSFFVVVVAIFAIYGMLLVPAVMTESVGLIFLAVVFLIVAMFPLSVLVVGAFGEHIKVYRRETASVGAMFASVKVNFWRKLGGLLWMELWVLLWSLLLIVPGIIKSYAYSMTTFILADNPSVTATQALKVSMKMTAGYKWRIFVFGLSFIGWILLPMLPYIAFVSIFVVTEAFIWLGLSIIAILAAVVYWVVVVYPYLYTALAGHFLELRDNALRNGKITPEELGMDAPVAAPHDPMII